MLLRPLWQESEPQDSRRSNAKWIYIITNLLLDILLVLVFLQLVLSISILKFAGLATSLVIGSTVAVFAVHLSIYSNTSCSL